MNFPHTPSQAVMQQIPERCPIDIPDFDGNGLDIEIAAAKKCLRVFYAQVLEIRKR